MQPWLKGSSSEERQKGHWELFIWQMSFSAISVLPWTSPEGARAVWGSLPLIQCSRAVVQLSDQPTSIAPHFSPPQGISSPSTFPHVQPPARAELKSHDFLLHVSEPLTKRVLIQHVGCQTPWRLRSHRCLPEGQIQLFWRVRNKQINRTRRKEEQQLCSNWERQLWGTMQESLQQSREMLLLLRLKGASWSH